ncbi:uncharacterized protein NECHADRAFT_49338 [Fusarium vanettenii 77-13-4]|uniref:Carboxylic ester hydrolase n=1 Tax=Fusarium vanettenii (strain ATCC MYA-4622 / CBS 123669 / FGSC 9596 / NRRL 45880 / 77-13-4) TaxID=660122 RepID=C7YUM7_FUSV7|nr:uncharacterized protein NECHADRAFT_49338 [Fusarium vanettenii 77-13-4]EEU44833.1 hypothetical protein NECHADRAFT_49338 [Fusarium vanettenii 77-13-4]
MISRNILVAALRAASALAIPHQRGSDSPTAVIDTGDVIGTTTSIPDSKVTVNKFLGIPFAEAPVRFAPPEPAKSWSKPYDASKHKPACVPKFNYPEDKRNESIKIWYTPPPPAGDSEDCLNINVFAPAGSKPGSKAVAFWIYGGSFHHGSGSLPLYDGSKMAGYEDIIVVTFNYRNNIFGFPETSDLPKGELNPGFLDQRLALDWVRRNIKAFGGDPEKVTIFGESAGAAGVDALLTAPPDPLPFRGAIIQSGTAKTSLTPSGSWVNATEKAGCKKGNFDETLKCMRELPADKLRDVVERAALTFMPLADDGVTQANYPRGQRLKSEEEPKSMARVPILIGTTAEEGRLPELKEITLEEALSHFASGITPAQIWLLRSLYPIGSPGINNEFDQITTIVTEIGAQCPTKFMADEFSSVGIKTRRFIYNASFENTEIFKGSGAYHAAELSTLFGSFPKKGATEYQDKLSRVMQKAWADFVKDPEEGPGWDEVPKVGVLGDGVRPDGDTKGGDGLEVIKPTLLDLRCHLYKNMWEESNPEE